MLSATFEQITEAQIIKPFPEVGLEIDTLIARWVFEWTEEKTIVNDWYDSLVNLWRPRPNNNGMTPSWSRNPIDAMQVIQEMANHGFTFKFSVDKSMAFYCQIKSDKGNFIGTLGEFSQVICIVSLKIINAI